MRKKKEGRKFHRKKDQRRLLKKSLAFSLVDKERIETTLAKAKEVSSLVEGYITRAKKGDVASRRILLEYLPKKSVNKLFNEIAPRYKSRNGGYIRIIRKGRRKSDGAQIAIVELIK